MYNLNMREVKPFVIANIKAGICPLLLGDAGIGKSSMVESLSEVFDTKVFTIPINQMADRADVTGARLVQDEHTQRWRQAFFPHATIDEAITYAKTHPKETPILFMDEINRASSDITSTVLAFITTRRIGTEDFPSNLRFVTAGNDKGNIVSLDDASLTRFAIYKVKPDVSTFLSVQSLNKFVESVVKKNPELIQAQTLAGDTESEDAEEDFMDILEAEESSFTQLTTPRTITFLSDFLNALGITGSGSDEEKEMMTKVISETNDDDRSLLIAGIEAHVGHTALAEKVFDEIFAYYQQVNSGVMTAGGNSYNWQPGTHVIKALHEAESDSDAETVLHSMSSDELSKLVLYFISGNGRTAIDNDQAIMAAANAAATLIETIDSNTKKELLSILLSDSYDKNILNAVMQKDSFAEVIDTINSVIS